MLINRGLCGFTQHLRTRVPVHVTSKSVVNNVSPLVCEKWSGNTVRLHPCPRYFHGLPTDVLSKPYNSYCRRPALGISVDFRSGSNREFNTCSVSFKKFNHERSGNQESERKTLRKDQEEGSPLILLIENKESDKVMSVTLKQAERIAKRRDLKLVQVEDPNLKGKTSRMVYKLITGKEYYEISRAKKEEKSSSGIKGEKSLTLNGNIAPNDLHSKLQNINKWITKGFQVRVTIAAKGASTESLEGVFSEIQKAVESMRGRILQRREKFGDTKFYIAPPKEKKVQKQQAEDLNNSPVLEDAAEK
ncbi:translation initiation factor IF-3 [Macrobrachium rosenbergii]|uniref:translation initiation factor IF-3 n=1 Tax=Macrobrachium rosenbergii TaxID=79674 RepID=UPI0034D6B1F7